VKFGYALARLGSRKEGLDQSHHGIQILESMAGDGTDAESSRWLGMAHWMLGDILPSFTAPSGMLPFAVARQNEISVLPGSLMW
jgi:hypothetical protein